MKNRRKLNTARASIETPVHETRVNMEFELNHCNEAEINLLMEEFHKGRSLDGATGLLRVDEVKFSAKEKMGSIGGSLHLVMVLETSECVGDFEAPIIATTIIEKYDEKRLLGPSKVSRRRAS